MRVPIGKFVVLGCHLRDRGLDLGLVGDRSAFQGQLGALAVERFFERRIGQPLDIRIGMTGQALLDSVDEALDIVDGDFAPHVAADIEQNEPPMGFVEDDDLGRFIEKIIDESLVEDRHALALRLGLPFGKDYVFDAKIGGRGPPLATSVPARKELRSSEHAIRTHRTSWVEVRGYTGEIQVLRRAAAVQNQGFSGGGYRNGGGV